MYTASKMYEKLLSIVILTPEILLCFYLSGTINLDSDFQKDCRATTQSTMKNSVTRISA